MSLHEPYAAEGQRSQPKMLAATRAAPEGLTTERFPIILKAPLPPNPRDKKCKKRKRYGLRDSLLPSSIYPMPLAESIVN